MATRTTLILGLLLSAACADPEVERLEARKRTTAQDVARLGAEIKAAQAELAKRPARAPSFEERANKLVEVFRSCEDPCAEALRAKSDDIRDEEKHKAMKTTIGACVARCFQ